MRPFRWAASGILAGGLALGLVGLGRGQQQQMLQYGFEGREPVLVQGPADAAYKETAHALSDEYAHSGQRSEHIQLQAEAGHFIHYTYDLGKAPVSDDLNVSLWLKANRPGLQLLCRVVLPRERDPNDPGQPLTSVLRGDDYKLVGRWQQLTLHQAVKRLREQQQFLQNELKRDVDVTDAYVDRILLNLYGGPGTTDVWVDDLEAGPVSEALSAGPNRAVPGQPAVRRRAAEVQLSGNRLLVAGQGFFLRGIRHTGTPLKTLRDAGFNTVWLDESAPAGLVEDAVNLGFWIVPSVTPPGLPGQDDGRRLVRGQLTSRDAFARTVSRFLDEEGVLCWDLGSNLDAEQFRTVHLAADAFRQADPMRPLAVDVWDGLQRYSRGVDSVLLGIHRWPLMTGLELPAYRDWLTQRRRLASPETYCWTWVQTHLPDWFTTVAYERPGTANFSEPIGPQAEQVRLLTYTAVASGCRGLGFWSDRFLADSHAGRDRLLALAQLNLELKMLEPLLVDAKEPEWVDTTVPEVKAAVLRTRNSRAILVLPVWMGPGAQYVTPQAGAAELGITVPQVPANAQAWEVTPARVRSYPCERVLGGTRVLVRDFNLTTALVLTSDLGPTGLVVRFQDQQRRMGKIAAQWAHDQALEELDKVGKVNDALEALGRPLPDGKALLGRAREFLDRCGKHRLNGEHAAAYEDAQLAQRALRVLMRAHWERAVKEMDSPVASPYAVSFFTLPRHWQFVDEILRRRAGANVLPDGGFETPPEQRPDGWKVQEVPTLDPVVPLARRVAEAPKEGKQCLMLQVRPKDPLLVPAALERTFLALNSPPVKLPPGTLVRISAWIKSGVAVSPDGALLYDSAGGEPLALRVQPTADWKRYYLYRRVPASGTISLTLATTGLGAVYFDDVRIEPLVPRDGQPNQLAPRPRAAAPR
jgi:hypothetical protein